MIMVENYIFRLLFYVVSIQVQILTGIVTIYKFMNAFVLKICCLLFQPYINTCCHLFVIFTALVASHFFICWTGDNRMVSDPGCMWDDWKSPTQTVLKALAFELQYAVGCCHGRTISRNSTYPIACFRLFSAAF